VQRSNRNISQKFNLILRCFKLKYSNKNNTIKNKNAVSHRQTPIPDDFSGVFAI
jgi:hypothetical protein